MRRVLLAALATACLLSVTVASATPVPATHPAAELEAITNGFRSLLPQVDAVQAVLDVRTAAVRERDQAGWMSTVDPEAPAEFRAAQARTFEGLTSVPIVDYRLEAHVESSGDLTPPGLSEQYGAPVFLPETREIYRFETYDDREAVDVLWLTFVQRAGAWFVGGDADLDSVGLETQRRLWDFGPVEVQSTDHLLVLSHPEDADRAAALAGIGDEAVEIISRRWDRPWSGKIPVIRPGSVDELEVLLQSTIDLDKFVAFVSYGWIEDAGGLAATAPRMYIQDRNLSRYGRAFQVETLVHELAHAAAVPVVSPHVPAWVHEGVADWIAVGQPTQERPPRGSDGGLPRGYEFTTGPQSGIIQSYNESRSAISFLARRHGLSAPSAFLAAAGQETVAPGNTDYHVDRALHEVGAGGFTAFEAAWAGRT